ncbi:MAG: hypothetical protein JNL98_31095 [Bryobacterales bacterium]|nr:hypothetical protein [Bryobacterales bacterium]
MTQTRRSFLQASTALVAASSGAAQGAGSTAGQPPRMKFGGVEISRLVLGVNPFYGYAHFNGIYGQMMRDWYTPEKVVEVMLRAQEFGINAFNYVSLGRGPQDWKRFLGAGGRMHLIPQVTAGDDAAQMVRDLKPLALQRQGEVLDKAWENGAMEAEHEWCKKARQLGVLVGVGTHKPEVIEYVEDKGWDVDFYAGCVYNRTRTPEEWRKVLGGEMMEMHREAYLQSDPPRMYTVMRQTKRPCFAFKILAAGRITSDRDVEQAFRTAFRSLKPIDGVYVGMCPRLKDEVKLNSELVARIVSET